MLILGCFEFKIPTLDQTSLCARYLKNRPVKSQNGRDPFSFFKFIEFLVYSLPASYGDRILIHTTKFL